MLLTLCAAVSPFLLPPEEAVRFEARLDLRPTGEQPAAGDRAEIRVELAWPDTVSASEAGLPAPILQLDVPACARLTEEHVTGYRALSRNEFLEAPYERLVRDTTASIPLELVAPPAEGDTVGLVLVAYVSDPAGERVRFLRRRIELPLAPGATSRAGDDLDSSWAPPPPGTTTRACGSATARRRSGCRGRTGRRSRWRTCWARARWW